MITVEGLKVLKFIKRYSPRFIIDRSEKWLKLFSASLLLRYMPQFDPYKFFSAGKKNIALVGATNAKSKYGNIIFNHLKGKGYTVYPVNPRAKEVEGEHCYHDLQALVDDNKQPDLINVVIPPKMGLEVVSEAARLSLDNLWFQPGAGSDDIAAACEKAGLNYVQEACTMVVAPPVG